MHDLTLHRNLTKSCSVLEFNLQMKKEHETIHYTMDFTLSREMTKVAGKVTVRASILAHLAIVRSSPDWCWRECVFPTQFGPRVAQISQSSISYECSLEREWCLLMGAAAAINRLTGDTPKSNVD